ncbi:hypothetical protein ATCC90586_009705 [Pythium insidiosum]|nr:hypothetical protein ATCC90586_009705 [Pythium insidiosum]
MQPRHVDDAADGSPPRDDVSKLSSEQLSTSDGPSTPQLARIQPPPLLDSEQAAGAPPSAPRPTPVITPERRLRRAFRRHADLLGLVLPANVHRHVNALLRRFDRLIALSYIVGVGFRTAAVFSDASLGCWFARLAFMLQLPGALHVLAVLRIEIAQLILRRYEFWFYFTVNTVATACCVAYYGDARISMLPTTWLELQIGTLLDAFIHKTRRIAVIAGLSAAFLVTHMTAITLGVVHAGQSHLIFSTRFRNVTVTEVYVNASGTLLILAIRVAYLRRTASQYRRRTSIRGMASTGTVQCIGLRCALQLSTDKMPTRAPSQRRKTSTIVRKSLDLVRGLRRKTRPLTTSPSTRYLQLRPMAIRQQLVATLVLVPAVSCWIGMRQWRQWLCHCLNVVGVVLTALSAIPAVATPSTALASVACSTVYGLIQLCSYHPVLLRRWLLSFDFLFISLQLSTAHVAMADLFRWALAPTCAIISSWLWMHAVLTIDLQTPVIRVRLGGGLTPRACIVILSLFVAISLAFTLDVLYWQSGHWHDRCFFRLRITDRRVVELHVVPFLLGRLSTLTLWNLRAIYRIAQRSSDRDLVLIQGNVEYDARHLRDTQIKRAPRAPSAERPPAETAVIMGSLATVAT